MDYWGWAVGFREPKYNRDCSHKNCWNFNLQNSAGFHYRYGHRFFKKNSERETQILNIGIFVGPK